MIRRPRHRALRLYAILFLLALYAPFAVLVIFSFNDSLFIAFPLKGLTLAWYRQLASNAEMLGCLANSLKVASAVACFSTAIGFFGARALTGARWRGRRLALALGFSPLVIPDIVLGVALLVLFLRLGLDLSLVTVALGHMLIATPFALALMMARLAAFDPGLEEASLDLGETMLGTLRRVTLPLVWPGVVASLMLTFLVSFDEFLIAFFLAGNEATLPVYMFGQLRFARQLPSLLALGVLVTAGSVVVIALAEVLRRRAVPRRAL